VDDTSLLDLDAFDCAEALARGAFTAERLVEASLARIARDNPAVGAFWFIDAEGARAAARQSDQRRMHGAALGPLDGLPLAIKANIDVAGWAVTAGLRFRASCKAATDAPGVARLRAQGMALIGITGMDEGALGTEGANPWYGVTQNPLRLGYSAGGSSSGSGAALAARMCPLALGTDTIGSLRIPASFCGCVALKPSPGIVSAAGLVPVHDRFDHLGPMARSIRDLRSMLAALRATGQGRDAAGSAALSMGVTMQRRGALGYAVGLDALAVSDAVIAAYQSGLAQLRRLGVPMVPIDLRRWDLPRLRRAILALCEMQMWNRHRDRMLVSPEDFSDGLRAFIRFGGKLGPDDVAAAERRIEAFGRDWAMAMQAFDAVLLPTVACSAFPHGERYPHNTADLTSIATAASLPALSLPLPVPAGALPVGLQLIGMRNADAGLLSLAEQVESVLRQDS
jgi:aspartyl-tRNA(Asn)/glutamyl-tRNA(Gln) amidotransferase subunit A